MTKRKRFRNGRGRKKRRQVRNNTENILSDSIEIARARSPETPLRDDFSTHLSTIFSSKILDRPTPREPVENPLNNEIAIDLPVITETPRRRSWNRERKSNYGSQNITNLNVIFRSDLSNYTPKSESINAVTKNSTLLRSRSSIPKLHSPGKEKSLSVNRGTQTNTDEYSKQINPITETPKYSTVLLHPSISTRNSFPFFKNQDSYNKTENDQITRFLEKGVNINPYLKNIEIDGKNRNNSYGELSFFSPNLLQHKISSTPIEKVLNKAFEIDEVVAINDLNTSKIELQNSFIDNSFATPKLNANLNVNDGISPDKLVNKEDSMKNLINSSTAFCRKTANIKASPKKKNILYSRIYSKSRHFNFQKVTVSRRSSTDSNCKLNSAGSFAKILIKLKKYCTVSRTWSVKVIDVCTQLGIQLKKTLSSICNIYKENPVIFPSESVNCKCENYKQDIEKLKEEIETQKKKCEDVEFLREELKKLKEEVAHFTTISKEIQSLKEKCRCFHESTANTASPPPCLIPPPPPPLPPPPPPPPPPPLMMSNANSLKITKKSAKLGESDKENSRPIISLDDILKVKLKKASDRFQTPVTRYNSQPPISIDMLRQVKLRPASRNSLRIETPESNMELTTSPHSTLCRLLKNESSLPRLKRLRRVGAYSYDSLYRKKELSRRDRESS